MRYDHSQLCLVPVGSQHTEDIFLYFTAEVARYMEAVPPKSRAETAKIICRWQKAAKDNAVFAIECLGSFLGLVSLHHLQTAPEAGLWLKREAQGRRYGSQAFSAMQIIWALPPCAIRWIFATRRAGGLPWPLGGNATKPRKPFQRKIIACCIWKCF